MEAAPPTLEKIGKRLGKDWEKIGILSKE